MTIELRAWRDPAAIRFAAMAQMPMSDVPTEQRPWCTHCGWVPADHACTAVEMSAEDEASALAALDGGTAATPAVVTYLASYCGVMEWTTPAGWIVRVFNDCGEWDYIASITSPDGRDWEYPFEAHGAAMTERIADWTPVPENYGGWPSIDLCPP